MMPAAVPAMFARKPRLLPAVGLALCLLMSVRAADVRDHGAKGDGVADDTDAIQRAVDAGGEVRFGRGTFRLTRSIRVDLQKTGLIALVGENVAVIEMHGAGPAFAIHGSVQRTASPDDFKAEFWPRERMPVVRGLAIVGRHPESVGLQATRTMQLTITQCHFRQLFHGIHITERNRNVIISDTHVYDCRGIGIYIDRCDIHQINIGNSHISYNKGGGIVGIGGAIRNLQMGHCDIESNVDPKVPPTANVQLDSTGGSIGEVEITGCTLQHAPAVRGFANIRFIGHSTRVPFTPEQRHGNLMVTGNLLNDADISLHLDGVRTAVISGNSIFHTNTHDVLVENSSQVVFSGNVLDRHPRYNPDNPKGPRFTQGIVFRDSDNCTLTGLRINGGKAPVAIAIQGGERFVVSNCSIANVEGVGLLLAGVSHSLVTGNLLDAAAGGPAALRVVGGSGNLIERNLVRGASEIDPASVLPPGK